MKTVDFKHFALQPGDRLLDLGCGEGRHVISAYVEGEVTAVGVDLCLKESSGESFAKRIKANVQRLAQMLQVSASTEEVGR